MCTVSCELQLQLTLTYCDSCAIDNYVTGRCETQCNVADSSHTLVGNVERDVSDDCWVEVGYLKQQILVHVVNAMGILEISSSQYSMTAKE